jgi:hypothetical protein
VEDGLAPAEYQVDVLQSLEERVVPSLAAQVTHAKGHAASAQRSALRIAIYSQDGHGLGHLRRTALIGRRLLAEAPDSAVLLFADSPVASFFKLPDAMDCVKLPSILKVAAGQWRPTSLPIPAADLQHRRSPGGFGAARASFRHLANARPGCTMATKARTPMPRCALGGTRPWPRARRWACEPLEPPDND